MSRIGIVWAALAVFVGALAPARALASESALRPPSPAESAAAAEAAGPAPAPPTPSAPASPEALALARTLAHGLLQDVNFIAMVDRELPAMVQAAGSLGEFRPEWPELLKQAMQEELATAKPVFEEVLAERFAAGFTAAELREGAGLFGGPAGREMSAIVAASAEGRPAPPMSLAGQRALAALNARPAGHSFLQKFGSMDALMSNVGVEFAARILPGVFIRFGQKAQAAEAARHPQ